MPVRLEKQYKCCSLTIDLHEFQIYIFYSFNI